MEMPEAVLAAALFRYGEYRAGRPAEGNNVDALMIEIGMKQHERAWEVLREPDNRGALYDALESVARDLDIKLDLKRDE